MGLVGTGSRYQPTRSPGDSLQHIQFDCAGTKWQHFARADRTSFENAAAYIAYAKDSQ